MFLKDEELMADLYFDVSVHVSPVEYCPTTEMGSYSGGSVSINTLQPPVLPAPNEKLQAGGSYVVRPGYIYFAPSIRINREDCSQRGKQLSEALQDRQILRNQPMYLEVTVTNHATKAISERSIRMYVAEEKDVCLPGNWRPLDSVNQNKSGGQAVQLGDVQPGETAWTPNRFRYVRMSDEPFFLIAQITDTDGSLNPLPKKTTIDPNELQESRQWTFLYSKNYNTKCE